MENKSKIEEKSKIVKKSKHNYKIKLEKELKDKIKIKKFIKKKLKEHNVYVKKKDIKFKSNIKEDAFFEFLNNQENEIFKNILNKKYPLFDIEIDISSFIFPQIESFPITKKKKFELIEDTLKKSEYISYFHINKKSVIIKLKDIFYPLDYISFYKSISVNGRISEIYLPSKNFNEGLKNDKSINSGKIETCSKDFDTEYKPIDETYRIRVYNEFINELKVLKLPLSIVYDEFLDCFDHIDTFIYLEESSEWPTDIIAIECALTAFYCQIYLKSKYRHSINNNWVILKYKEIFFKVRIKFRSIKLYDNKFFNSHFMPALPRYNDFENYIRIFLSAHGYLDYFHPILIKIIALRYQKKTPGSAFVCFLKNGVREFCYDWEKKIFSSDSKYDYKNLNNDKNYNREVSFYEFKVFSDHWSISFKIDEIIINRLNILIRKVYQNISKINLMICTYNTRMILKPSIRDYDFVLSDEYIPNSFKVGNLERKLIFELDDDIAYYFYSAYNRILMVKMKCAEKMLGIHYIVLNTGFRYLLEVK
ncbi:hypothetical protein DMUE_3889 [Dictyocoela muelleri]|nr:hypothetical protein DMUE_3889 [Dictyocoela muelleri]